MHIVQVGAMLCKSFLGTKETAMDMFQVHNIAKRLIEANGLKAEVEAAVKLREARQAGDTVKIELWQKVQSAIHEMKAAHES
jgi:hypothetical protein